MLLSLSLSILDNTFSKLQLAIRITRQGKQEVTLAKVLLVKVLQEVQMLPQVQTILTIRDECNLISQ